VGHRLFHFPRLKFFPPGKACPPFRTGPPPTPAFAHGPNGRPPRPTERLPQFSSNHPSAAGKPPADLEPAAHTSSGEWPRTAPEFPRGWVDRGIGNPTPKSRPPSKDRPLLRGRPVLRSLEIGGERSPPWIPGGELPNPAPRPSRPVQRPKKAPFPPPRAAQPWCVPALPERAGKPGLSLCPPFCDAAYLAPMCPPAAKAIRLVYQCAECAPGAG